MVAIPDDRVLLLSLERQMEALRDKAEDALEAASGDNVRLSDTEGIVDDIRDDISHIQGELSGVHMAVDDHGKRLDVLERLVEKLLQRAR